MHSDRWHSFDFIFSYMLKRFFISMLGTMAGLWISIFIFILCGSVLLGYAIGKGSAEAINVKKNSILYFDLSGEVAERYQPASFIDMLQQTESTAPTLEDMLGALRAAATDDRIDGLYLNCGGSSLAPASREELIEGIRAFKTHGKWVVAYADTYLQGDYTVASLADQIVLNPVGCVDIHGLGGMTPFFKNLLDKIGVKMQIIKVGTYKSAVEPFVLTSMSEPARRQTQQYIDSIWGYMADVMAQGRDLPIDSIFALAPQMIYTRKAQTFVDAGLVDTLLYRHQAEDMLRDLTSTPHDKDLRLVCPADYLTSKAELTIGSSKRHIALLYALGEIYDSGKEGIVGPDMVQEVLDLAKDENVAGMVLRVNSPGGSAFASEQIWEALQTFKSTGKPLYVSMGDYAASGGYYISCGADSIFADSTTITGSIGVFGMIPDLSGLVTDKVGITFSTVSTNPNIGINSYEPMTPYQHAAMQKSVENIYELFTSRVAAGRNLDIDFVKSIAEGRVWVGTNALELGLVDTLGSLRSAVQAMADDLGLDAKDVVAYPLTKEKFWEKLLLESGSLDDLKAAGYDLETLRYINYVRNLCNANPMQARMEYLIVE